MNKHLELNISTRKLDAQQDKLIKKLSIRGVDSVDKLSRKDQEKARAISDMKRGIA